MRNVDEGADEIGETKFDALPERVQLALGELAGAAKEGLLALSVGVGLGVLTELMAEEVEDVVGPKGRHDADRAAVRHGHEDGSVTLGGRRVPVQRPRVRAADGSGEVATSTYAHFADRDPLTKVVLEQMLAGVSTRRFTRTREPVGQDALDAERSTSKSAVSREFVGRTGEHLRALMARSLEDIRLAALMLDGLELKGRCCVVALGITTDGVKVPLGLWDGSTENKRALGIDGEGAKARDGKRVKATEAVGERTQLSYQREAADETADRRVDLGAARSRSSAESRRPVGVCTDRGCGRLTHRSCAEPCPSLGVPRRGSGCHIRWQD